MYKDKHILEWCVGGCSVALWLLITGVSSWVTEMVASVHGHMANWKSCLWKKHDLMLGTVNKCICSGTRIERLCLITEEVREDNWDNWITSQILPGKPHTSDQLVRQEGNWNRIWFSVLASGCLHWAVASLEDDFIVNVPKFDIWWSTWLEKFLVLCVW